jgi:ABC-type multidrug transport system fused ATPase/permease subunit
LGAAVATTVVVMAVTFREHVSGGQVGIALNVMLVANSTLLKLVENWTTLEASFGAIARLKTLEETTTVEGGRTCNLEPPENWPSRGHIQFQNVTASYEYVSSPKPLFEIADKCTMKTGVSCSTESEPRYYRRSETHRVRAYGQVSLYIKHG